MEEKKREFYCHLCNFKTKSSSDWIKHIGSQKHKRLGETLPKDCKFCGYKASSYSSLKSHLLVNHSTIEERMAHNYYCDKCDLIFFNEKTLKYHYETKRHKNMVIALQYQEEVNKIPKKEKIDNNLICSNEL